MFFEQHNTENKKITPGDKLLEILRREPRRETAEIDKIEMRAKIFVEKEKLNWHDDFLGLIEPKLKDAKILDLFCGSNSIKEYGKEKRLNMEVVGVDISSEKADIKADVAEIDKFISPEKQFDIVFDLGGVPGVISLEKFETYLKDGGFFITSSSAEIFLEQVNKVFKNKKFVPGGQYEKETKEALEYFQPIVEVEVRDKKSFLPNQPIDSVYVIWKKRAKE